MMDGVESGLFESAEACNFAKPFVIKKPSSGWVFLFYSAYDEICRILISIFNKLSFAYLSISFTLVEVPALFLNI